MLSHRSLVILLTFVSCDNPDKQTPDVAAGGSPRHYQLVRIGGAALSSPAQALRACDLRPYYGWYELEASRWQSGDSAFVGCGNQPRDTNARFTTATGSFRLRADTIEFLADDTTVGDKGVVNRGRLRADTLTIWGSDLDGGDYVFVRSRK